MEHTTFSDFVADRHRQDRELYCLFEGSIVDDGVDSAQSVLAPNGTVKTLPDDELTDDLAEIDLLVCNVPAMESEDWQNIVIRQRTGRVTQTDLLAVDTGFDHSANRVADAKITTTDTGAVDSVYRLIENVYENSTLEREFGGGL